MQFVIDDNSQYLYQIPQEVFVGFCHRGDSNGKYLIRPNNMVNVNSQNLFCLLFCTLEKDSLLLQCTNGPSDSDSAQFTKIPGTESGYD